MYFKQLKCCKTSDLERKLFEENLRLLKKRLKSYSNQRVSVFDSTLLHYLDVIDGKVGLFRLVDATEEGNINLELTPLAHFVSDCVPGVPPVFMLVSADDVILVELQWNHCTRLV